MGILEVAKWPTSQADYNGPKQQCKTVMTTGAPVMLQLIRMPIMLLILYSHLKKIVPLQ